MDHGTGGTDGIEDRTSDGAVPLPGTGQRSAQPDDSRSDGPGANADSGRESGRAVLSEYFKTEYQGLIAEHMNMWNIFSSTVKLYFGIVASPFIVVAALLEQGSLNLTPVSTELRAMLISVGAVGFLFTFAIIRYRLDVLLYARWLNRLRHALAEESDEVKACLEAMKLPGKDEPNVPASMEWPPRPMAMMVLLAGTANSVYLSVGIGGQVSYHCIWTSALGALVHFIFYGLIAGARQISGAVNRD